MSEAGACISVVISAEEDRMYRIQARLHRLEDIPQEWTSIDN
jgi:hypothetical protein